MKWCSIDFGWHWPNYKVTRGQIAISEHRYHSTAYNFQSWLFISYIANDHGMTWYPIDFGWLWPIFKVTRGQLAMICSLDLRSTSEYKGLPNTRGRSENRSNSIQGVLRNKRGSSENWSNEIQGVLRNKRGSSENLQNKKINKYILNMVWIFHQHCHLFFYPFI